MGCLSDIVGSCFASALIIGGGLASVHLVKKYTSYNNAQSSYAAVRALSITNHDPQLSLELAVLKEQCDKTEKELLFTTMIAGSFATLLAGASITFYSAYKSDRALQNFNTEPTEPKQATKTS